MSVFYFTTSSGDVYELSSTSRIQVREPAVVTRSPVESGKSIVDNYYLDNRVITFDGIITDVKVTTQDQSRTRPVDQWIQEIRQLRLNKERVTVHVHSLELIPNCVITGFDIDKDRTQGLTGWSCTLSFQEVEISERARLVDIPEAQQQVKDVTDPKAKGSSSSTKEVPDELATTIGVRLGTAIIGG